MIIISYGLVFRLWFIIFVVALLLIFTKSSSSSSSSSSDDDAEKDDNDDEVSSIIHESSKERSCDVTTRATTTTLFDSSDDDNNNLQQLKWKEIKDKICPNMVPNGKRIWKTIFQLAREELSLVAVEDNDTTTTHQQQKQKKSLSIIEDKFFDFSAGGIGFTYNNSEDHHSSSIMIYLRIWKAGNDHIRKNLERILNNTHNNNNNNNSSPVEEDGINNTNFFQHRYQENLFRTLKIPEKVPKNSNDHHHHLCIVTAVRDPISHFISGYNEVEVRAIRRPHEKRLFKPVFVDDEVDDDDEVDEKYYYNPLAFTRYKIGSAERFRQFVSDFLVGPTPADIGINETSAELAHLYSMTGILHELKRHQREQHPDLQLTAYLPNLTNLSTNFPKFVIESCPPGDVPSSVFGEPFDDTIGIHNTSNKDEYGFKNAAMKIWNENGNTARALCALHVLDYACYDLIPVPELCRDVFSKEQFREKILLASSKCDTSFQSFFYYKDCPTYRPPKYT